MTRQAASRAVGVGTAVVSCLALAGCKKPAPKHEPLQVDVFFTANVGGEIEPCG